MGIILFIYSPKEIDLNLCVMMGNNNGHHEHHHPQHGQHGHHPTQHGHHPPQHGNHPPQHRHHPPQHGHHPPQHGHHPPQHGHGHKHKLDISSGWLSLIGQFYHCKEFTLFNRSSQGSDSEIKI